jgi:hypothetical protein
VDTSKTNAIDAINESNSATPLKKGRVQGQGAVAHSSERKLAASYRASVSHAAEVVGGEVLNRPRDTRN